MNWNDLEGRDYSPNIWLEGMRKSTEYLRRDSRDSNQVYPKSRLRSLLPEQPVGFEVYI
jgi:hypothetical protein